MTLPVGILLAAGRGRRFDPAGQRNKLLQPLAGGDAVVVASARNLLGALARVIAVVRADDGVASALRALGCEVVVCTDADAGMATSLVHALRHAPSASGWVIALGDMPHVQPSTVRALAAALEAGADIAAPTCNGRRGNPVAFSHVHGAALLALQGDEGARGIVKANPVTEVDVSDPGIHQDIDTPADMRK